MILKEIYNHQHYILTFIYSKGRKIMYTTRTLSFDNNRLLQFEIGKSYKILKTKNKIYQVLSLSEQTITLNKKTKESYWLN